MKIEIVVKDNGERLVAVNKINDVAFATLVRCLDSIGVSLEPVQSDSIERFLDRWAVFGPDRKVERAHLWKMYSLWHGSSGLGPIRKKDFFRVIRERFGPTRLINGVHYFYGFEFRKDV